MKRSTKLLLNVVFSTINQILIFLSGIIIPRFILKLYGDDVNGLVSSITSFLGMISLAECGVGAVIESALYKPLAEKDNFSISKIIVASERFFRRIAVILAVYIAALIAVYPFTVTDDFDFMFTSTLIIVISISSFAQYFFAMTYRLLLNADQMGFVQLIFNSVTVVLTTVFSVLMMESGSSIQMVKLLSSVLFLLQPLGLTWYVKKFYKLDKHVKFTEEPLKQKWNGFAQHFSAYVMMNVPVVVLTLMSTLQNVSIYTVYHMVVAGVRQIVTILTSGMHSLMGNMYARKEKHLESFFALYEWILHNLVVVLFTVTGILIIPFINIYTSDITDVTYALPLFSITITVAQAMHCLRLPYKTMVLAVGHYKQTQAGAIIEAIADILISVVVVWKFGLIGVAVGMFVSMSFGTFYLAHYLSKNVLNRSIFVFVKQILFDIFAVLCCVWVAFVIPTNISGYFDFFISGIISVLLVTAVLVIINLLLYRNNIVQLLKYLKKRIQKA